MLFFQKMNINIREFEHTDASDLLHLIVNFEREVEYQRLSTVALHAANYMVDELVSGSARAWVNQNGQVSKGNLVGYTSTREHQHNLDEFRQAGDVEIEQTYLLPTFRGIGLGLRLQKHVIDELEYEGETEEIVSIVESVTEREQISKIKLATGWQRVGHYDSGDRRYNVMRKRFYE